MFGKATASNSDAQEYWQTVGCQLFGKTNVWWYNLRDSNPDNEAKFAITSDLSTTPSFNLTCPAVKTTKGGDGTISKPNSTSTATFPGSTDTSSSSGGSNITTGTSAGTRTSGAAGSGTSASSPVVTGVASSAGAMMGLTMCILLGTISFLL
ncbi:glycoside hydrolase [Venturia nashicola]|nr:glycoside hydrolase [Venturia nashicola]